MPDSVASALDAGSAVLIDSVRGHGVAAIHRAGGAGGAETHCSLVIDENAEPVFRGGQVIVEEDKFTGYVRPAEVPAVNRRDEFEVVATGEVYRVHDHPRLTAGLHVMVFRKES